MSALSNATALEQARALAGLFGQANPGIVEQIAAALKRAAADAYERAVTTMMKRVYIYQGEDTVPSLMNDGAVPCWWLKQEAERIRAKADALESHETTTAPT